MTRQKLWIAVVALTLLSTVGAVAQEAKQQRLKPTKVVVDLPPGWFYAESHSGSVLEWTISKEDTADGKGYETGVKVQSFYGFKHRADQTPSTIRGGFDQAT